MHECTKYIGKLSMFVHTMYHALTSQLLMLHGMALSVFDATMSFFNTVLFVTNDLKEDVKVVLTT